MRVKKYVVRTRLLGPRDPRLRSAVQAAFRVAAGTDANAGPLPASQVRHIEKKRSFTP